MNSPETRKLIKMSRFWVAAVIIMVVMLSACATTPSPSRPAVLAADGSAPTVQVVDIEDALARFLSAEGDQLILLPNRLQKSELDYSLGSLKLIDRWLADIHTINKLQGEPGKAGEILVFDGRGDNSVIFAGLYLGQVIRANSALDWQWQRFDTFLAANPVYQEHYGRDPGLDSFVLVGPQGAATPINTALKRVLYGKEESVHFIGQWLLTEVDLDAAISGQNLLGLDRRDWPN